MNLITAIKKTITKRPSMPVLVGALMLAAAVFNALIPVMAMIVGIINMTGGGFFDSVMSIIQLLIDPDNLPTILIAAAGSAILVSVVSGLLLPGFLMIVDDGLAMGKREKGLFARGIRRCFFRFFLMTLGLSFITLLLFVFLLVAAIPAIIVTKAAASTNPDLTLVAVFIDLITLAAFIMCLMFFKVYVYMWYIAAAKMEKRPFAAGKAVAGRIFGRAAVQLLGFDIVFAAVIYLIYLNESQLLRYVLGWVFATAFFTTLAVYLVRLYNTGSGPEAG
ncbi:MAG: hypothetical protein ACOX4M_03195 [Acetivibrionales bacterium]